MRQRKTTKFLAKKTGILQLNLTAVRQVFVIPVSWAHQDLNLGPTDYESAALTN